MLIEYRLEFQASGLTITQRIDMDGSAPPAKYGRANQRTGKAPAQVQAQPQVQPSVQAAAIPGVELPEHIIVPASTAAIPGARSQRSSKSWRRRPRIDRFRRRCTRSTDPGGGGPTAGIVIAFGPIVMLPSRGSEAEYMAQLTRVAAFMAQPIPGGGVHGTTDPGGSGGK